jgi:hypothetical protein
MPRAFGNPPAVGSIRERELFVRATGRENTHKKIPIRISTTIAAGPDFSSFDPMK